jgi:porphobilinogen synthase
MQSIETFTLPLVQRPRRNRLQPAIRNMIEETLLLPRHLVSSLFVIEGNKQEVPIPSMPGIHRLSIDKLLEEIESLVKLGIESVDLFAYLPKEDRDHMGREGYREGNLLQKAIRTVKAEFPHLCVMADVALDPYTSHGHDGVIDERGYVINDLTVQLLGEMSLRAAEAGADIVAPSDMMDGRVAYIRQVLDQQGFQEVGILSYAAKFASAMYAPFRDILDSAPQVGDKKNYQLNPANKREALREAQLDVEEGADILLIKPAISYLDIISEVRKITNLPIAAYHVSGEYAMVMAAAQLGWMNAQRVFREHLLSIRRAGADIILTYAAKQVFGRS